MNLSIKYLTYSELVDLYYASVFSTFLKRGISLCLHSKRLDASAYRLAKR